MQIVEIIKALVRPFLATSAWAATLYLIVSGSAVPGELWAIATLLSGFYFGERAVKKT